MKSFWETRRLPFAVVAIASVVVAASLVETAKDHAGGKSAVIAYVNASPLTRERFERAWYMETVSFAVLKEKPPKPGSPAYAALRRRVAALMIRRRVLRLEANARAITVGDSELRRLIEAVVEDRFGGDESALQSDLRRKGILLSEFRESIRDQAIEQRLFGAVTRGVTVSTGAVRRYYVAHREDFKVGFSRQISFAAFRSHDEADSVRREFAAQRALPVDQAQSVTVDRSRVSPALWRIVASTKRNAISAPVKSGDAWYLISPVEPIRSPRLLPLSDAEPEIRYRLLRAKKRRIFEDWVRQASQRQQVRFVDDSLDPALPPR